MEHVDGGDAAEEGAGEAGVDGAGAEDDFGEGRDGAGLEGAGVGEDVGTDGGAKGDEVAAPFDGVDDAAVVLERGGGIAAEIFRAPEAENPFELGWEALCQKLRPVRG